MHHYFFVKLLIHVNGPEKTLTETHGVYGPDIDPMQGIETLKKSIKASFAQNAKYAGKRIAVTVAPGGITEVTKEAYEDKYRKSI